MQPGVRPSLLPPPLHRSAHSAGDSLASPRPYLTGSGAAVSSRGVEWMGAVPTS